MTTISENSTSEPERKLASRLKGSSIISVIFVIGVITFVLLFLVVRFALTLKPFRVGGSVMSPTITNQDMVLTSRAVNDLQRGDIITFRHHRDPAAVYVRRVIALPGETISIDETGQLFINDELQREPYMAAENSIMPVIVPKQTLGANHYWVMGDNRDNSHDSRNWGPITREAIVSKVVWRYWPPAKFGGID